MTITTYSDLVTLRAGNKGGDVNFFKAAYGGVTTSWYTPMRMAGNPAALGDNYKAFTRTNATTMTCAAYGLDDGTRIWVYSTTTLPSGLAENTAYFTHRLTVDTLTLHTNWADALAGSNAVSTADAGAGTHYITFIARAIQGGSIMNADSVGAMPFRRVTAGERKNIISFAYTFSSSNHAYGILYDVLWAGRWLDMNSASAQTINSIPLTRYTNGFGNQIILNVAVALGSTPANATIVYTDDTDTQRTVSGVPMVASAAANRHPHSPLAAGCNPFFPLDPNSRGVKSIQSFQLSAGMGTAGAYCDVYIVHPIMIFPSIVSAAWIERDTTANIDAVLPLECGSTGIGPFLSWSTYTIGATTNSLTGIIRTVNSS